MSTVASRQPEPKRHKILAQRIDDILEKLDEPRFPKVDELLGKVFAAPEYENLSILEREAAVLDFIASNRNRWQAMLIGEGLFAQQTPENIDAISTRCVLERTNRKLIRILIDEVRAIDYRFVEIIKDSDDLSETLPLDIIDIGIRSIKRLSGRSALIGPYEVIRSDMIDRYTTAADEMGGVISVKAFGPLKKHLNVREICHCLKAALVLKNGIFLSVDSAGEDGFSGEEIETAIVEITEKYPEVPGFLAKMALYANLARGEWPNVPLSARLCALLSGFGARLLSAKRNLTDPGGIEHVVLAAMAEEFGETKAESIDSSMLEELIIIAQENSW